MHTHTRARVHTHISTSWTKAGARVPGSFSSMGIEIIEMYHSYGSSHTQYIFSVQCIMYNVKCLLLLVTVTMLTCLVSTTDLLTC